MRAQKKQSVWLLEFIVVMRIIKTKALSEDNMIFTKLRINKRFYNFTFHLQEAVTSPYKCKHILHVKLFTCYIQLK